MDSNPLIFYGNKKMAKSELNDCLKLVGKIAVWIVVIFIVIGYISKVIDSVDWHAGKENLNRMVYPSYYKRVDFLKNNCEEISGYEDLNYGKTTFKCPNGKEYMEKLPNN